MHRFFCPNLPALPTEPILSGLEVELDDEEARHAKSVLRLKSGQEILLFNGQGGLALARLTAVSPLRAAVVQHIHQPRPQPALTLAVAPPKGSRLEDMIDQLSQLGVDRVALLRTQRSVVEPGANKQRRLQRAVIESAKQCGRAWLMQVSDLAPLSQTLAEPADLTLLAQPGAPVISDLADRLRQAASVRVMIGPEGGFTDDEVQQMQARGATPWSLGPHILRIETAAAAAAAVVRHLAPTPPTTKPDDWTTGDLRV